MAKEYSIGDRVLDILAAPAEAVGGAIFLLSAPLLLAAAIGSLGLGYPVLCFWLFKAAGISANSAVATNTALGIVEAGASVAAFGGGAMAEKQAAVTWGRAWTTSSGGH